MARQGKAGEEANTGIIVIPALLSSFGLFVFLMVKSQLFIPAMVVAEVTYLVGTRLGPQVEAAFLASLSGLDVEAPSASDWPRIAQLVERYADFPLGGTDASVMVLAERLGTDVIITLDRRHFGAARGDHQRAWRLLPE